MNRRIVWALMLAMSTGCQDLPAGLSVLSADAGGGSQDASGPLSDVGETDAAVDMAMPPPQLCQWANDCPGGDCIDGICRTDQAEPCGPNGECPDGEICGGYALNGRCATPCELAGECPLRTRPCTLVTDCPLSQQCEANRCVTSCVIDMDCSPGHCMDGICLPFPTLLRGDSAQPLGLPGQLYAGVAVLPLDYPMGVSQAGYGGRTGASTPYNVSLGGTDRVLERQDVRVIVLSDEDDLLILLRMPLSWSTDYLRTRTAMALQALTVDEQHPDGINYLDHIVTSATHSHSHPGRFWHLLSNVDLGTLGFGTFSGEMVDRYAQRFAETIKVALDNARPARFGFTVIEDFDPEGRIHSDRRPQSAPFIDDRLLVWRVDDMDGVPMAALVNFAVHGTHLETTTITGDAAAGVEVVLTHALSAQEGTPVPVVFANGNGGNVSPRGDDIVSQSFAKIQLVGHRLWPIFAAAWETISPASDVPVEVITQRIPIDYERLGYDASVPDFRDEFGNIYRHGAFFCASESRSAEAPYVDGDLGCSIDPRVFNGAPLPNAHKTVLSVFRVGNLLATTLPGEPTSELGMLLAGWVEMDASEMGMADVRSVNFGYSQDHQLYLLTQDDWFYGGYEAANNWFGWRLGEYLAEESRRLARALTTPVREPVESEVRPMWWPSVDFERVPPTPTPGGAGRIVGDVEESVSRGGTFEVRWMGGHPGVDLPRVRLEQGWGGGTFSPVERPGGLPFDDGGFESVLRYHGDYAEDHVWSIRWELPVDFVGEEVRLAIEGRHWTPAGASTYAFHSPTLAINPATLVVRHVEMDAESVSFHVNWPDSPSNDDGVSAFETLQWAGHWVRFEPTPEMDSSIRRWTVFLGPQLPADSRLWVGTDGREFPSEAHLSPSVIQRTLVTARDAEGVETTVPIPRWPSHRVTLPRPDPDVSRLFLRDAYGNLGIVPLDVEP